MPSKQHLQHDLNKCIMPSMTTISAAFSARKFSRIMPSGERDGGFCHAVFEALGDGGYLFLGSAGGDMAARG